MADSFDCFSVLFVKDEVFVNGQALPLGQCSTDILNLDDEVPAELDRRIDRLMPAVKDMLSKKTDSDARSAQELLNAVWDMIFALPVYRTLALDRGVAYDLFPFLLSDRESWEEVQDERSEAHAMFRKMLDGLEYFPESLRVFRGQVSTFLELYVEPLKRRSVDAYAMAYMHYFNDMAHAGAVLFGAAGFGQNFPLEVKFVPLSHPTDKGKVILAEKAEFGYLTHFLYTEFYRALVAGNAPRRCHNCGCYFLLTAGYNTCYCNNLAPSETERTCRKVGAHRKEAKERATATPAQKEYARAYNRLKMRKQRGKISVDEWNEAVGKAQDLKTQTERGELSDEELRRQLESL